ncbi:hypothetical protein WJX73_001833 [Symbiochloris irregularis]|uniref:Aromatic amino acid beta-eliminating lyase/threonine aldolase domain-containing protein n=1 Tax=Symbiochloris irregularis TaxID=706552 RepID=A0AAW1NS25_9CHLO
MLQAEVGDDVYGEDPEINRLQEEAARLVGKEAALYVCSGTMGNLSAVLAHCNVRGSEVIVGDQSHVYQYEASGISVLGGIGFNVLRNTPDGQLLLDDIKQAIRPEDQHSAVTRCICIETTHNRCGGAVLPLPYLRDLYALAQSKGLAVHMDGARMFNAATALGAPITEITACADSVQFCLSKGLGAPAGSMVAGSKKFIAQVHKLRKMLGGGQRQIGVLAAPGRIALNEMTNRLQEDHDNAQLLAKEIATMPNASLDPGTVQSNIIVFHVQYPYTPSAVVDALKRQGVLAIPFKGGVRMVTHFDVSREDCEAACKALKQVLSKPLAEQNGHANGGAQNGGAYGH